MSKFTGLQRGIVAVIAGAILGNLVAIVASIGINASYGTQSATGGDWYFNIPNLLYSIIIGLLVGFFAGFIGKRKGWLVGLLAQISPTFIIIIMAVYGGVLSEVSIIHWTTLVGIIPAMISGALGAGLANDHETITKLKLIRWHWLWLWAVLLMFLCLISGSLRFLINDAYVSFQAIFKPSVWLWFLLFSPLIGWFPWLTFQVPILGTVTLLSLLDKENTFTKAKRTGLIALIVLGTPILFLIIYAINSFMFNFLATKGLRII